MPGTPGTDTRSLAEEVVSIARSELPGLDGRIGYLDGGDDTEFPGLATVLTRTVEERTARYEQAKAAGAEVTEPEGPAAVVVPLLAGPHPVLLDRIRQEVAASGTPAELTDVLGPHPLLAEALHVRLSEAGLARADRARLFTVATAADGIVLASVGGADAVQAAGITGMLLAARLAVPVMAAPLDEEGAIAATAEELRAAGAGQLALAPYLIGPEIDSAQLETAAKEAGCSAAEPLAAYPAVGRLALSQYAAVLGIKLPEQGTPGR
ncbi:hypothetical protein Sm713_78340 [Streptomyces sp. TS71-3]|nr:hypothetical protein Sm713_78340 [Streptomyces sp. TS71-3]